MIILDLPDFHGLCASLSVTFDMYFNGRNKDILFVYLFIYLFIYLLSVILVSESKGLYNNSYWMLFNLIWLDLKTMDTQMTKPDLRFWKCHPAIAMLITTNKCLLDSG